MLRTRNNIFQNWYKDMYVARKIGVEYDDYNNEIVTYDTPFYFGKVNYEPLTSKNLEAYIKEYGETSNTIISGIIDYIDKDKFKEFDLVYLYGATPKEERVNGENANYIVKAFKPQNTKIMVLLEKLTKEVADE